MGSIVEDYDSRRTRAPALAPFFLDGQVTPFRFGYAVGRVSSRSELQELARRLEDGGWSSFLVSDHLGSTSSFPPLVLAASVTDRLRVGNLVLNNDFFHPLRLAQEASTVDILSEGRLELGLGSGWNEPEYELLGVDFDPARRRAERLAAAVRAMKQAWAGEPTLSFGENPLPAVPPSLQQPHPPLLIGGHGDTIMSLAAREADVIGLTGITWDADGVSIRAGSFDSLLERRRFVVEHAGHRAASLEFNVLVQSVSVGRPLEEQVEPLAEQFGVSPDYVRTSPLILAGSASEVEEKLHSIREGIGISYFSVSRNAIDDLGPIVAKLAGT